ncbi:putative vesicle-associated membrane-protein-associated protein [Helianthus anomalus]
MTHPFVKKSDASNDFHQLIFHFFQFVKDDGKHIEEKRLKVILVSPPHSPILSPMNMISRMRPHNTATESNDDMVQNNSSHTKEVLEAMKNEQSINRKHIEELRLRNDVEEIKSKLREFESILKQDNPRTNENARTRETGFQLLFVAVVALVSIYLGYLLHS